MDPDASRLTRGLGGRACAIGATLRQVLLIAAEFPPVSASGVQRILKFTKYLPQYGWMPTVITGPSQRSLYHALDLQQLAEVDDRITVHRTRQGTAPRAFHRLQTTAAGKALIRVLTFPDTFAFWIQPAYRLACSVLASGRFDAVLSTDPVSTHIAAALAARRFSLPWICDVRDLWTDGFHFRPTSYLHRVAGARVDRALLRHAKGLSLATEGFERFLLERYPFIRAKTRVVRNGYDESDFFRNGPTPQGKFTMVYSGEIYGRTTHVSPKGIAALFEPLTHGPGVYIRSTREIVRALELALARCPEMRSDFELVFVGAVAENHAAYVRESPVSGLVRLTGQVPHAEAVEWLQRAHALFLMQDGAGSELVVPAKVYEYMRAGKPILGLFRPGETPDLLKGSGLGYLAHPTDTEQIAEKLVDLYRGVRENRSPEPNLDFIRGLTRERATQQLARLLDAVVEEHP